MPDLTVEPSSKVPMAMASKQLAKECKFIMRPSLLKPGGREVVRGFAKDGWPWCGDAAATRK